jgi:AcrR family transcriptional regulator
MRGAQGKMISTNIKNASLVEKRRQQIFEAVVKLFSKKGYHRTTMREISKESGIALGNLYDYIATKDDILYIIQEKATEAVMQAISKSKEGDRSPAERLGDLIHSELRAMDRYQDLIMIIYQESHAMAKQTLHALLRSERKHLQAYEKLLKEGMAKGVFRRSNPRMTANMIKMLIDAWVIKRWDLRKRVTLSEMEKGISDLVFQGILRSNERDAGVRR